MKILLIEDDPIWQAKMQQILINNNYNQINTFDNLTDSYNYLVANDVELIIADVQIGEDLVFDLFESDKFKDIPIIFITSSESAEYYNLTSEVQNSYYLVKPFHEISVLSAIKNVKKGFNQKMESSPKGLFVRGIYHERIF